MQLQEIQSALRTAGLDGWLFCDHHHRDPLAYRILGLSEASHVTRRWFYLIPAEGEPKKLVHRIEESRLDPLPGIKTVYSTWQEREAQLLSILDSATRLAMQYSPHGAIAAISLVDAGMVEMLRAMGKIVVSSADLVSHFEAVLTEDQIASHYAAQRSLDLILAEGFREIGSRIRQKTTVTEFDMVAWLQEAMRREGLVWDSGPNVSVNRNSSNSHYEPTPDGALPIAAGDFVLIDIWAKKSTPNSIYYDITWTGVVGREPSAREQHVFETVIAARDATIRKIEQAFAVGLPIMGWEADDAARSVITVAGFGDAFTHRTGHNIGMEVHGAGAHLDNFETHDERRILPDTCFSIEPGIYLLDFGIRSEVNMIARAGEAAVTGRIQRQLVRI